MRSSPRAQTAGWGMRRSSSGMTESCGLVVSIMERKQRREGRKGGGHKCREKGEGGMSLQERGKTRVCTKGRCVSIQLFIRRPMCTHDQRVDFDNFW